jgi:hypothetical protein
VNPAYGAERTAGRGRGMRRRGVSPALFYSVSGLGLAAVAVAIWAWQRPVAGPAAPRARFRLEIPDSEAVAATSGTAALAISPDGDAKP